MNIRIAVSHPVAIYRRGLLGALTEAGFSADEPEDLFAWTAQEGRRAAILEVKPSNIEIAIELHRGGSDLIIIGLLAEPSECAYRAALRLDVFPVRWDSPPAYIVDVLRMAIERQALLPQEVACALAHDDRELRLAMLSEAERSIVACLGKGDTNRRIASRLHVSERSLRRRLQQIYFKLNVSGRQEASALFVRHGSQSATSATVPLTTPERNPGRLGQVM